MWVRDSFKKFEETRGASFKKADGLLEDTIYFHY